MYIEVCKEFYTVKLVHANPSKTYLFGDNNHRYGKGGQAIIRDEPNTVGIRTKKYPGTGDGDYFTDKEFYSNCRMIIEDLSMAFARRRIIVIPAAGIGTGRAELQKRAPKTFKFLQACLKGLYV